jgi:hypothetical protein
MVAAAVLAAAALLAVTAARADADAVVNNNPAFLEVVTNNVENLPQTDDTTCPGDWQDLYWYINERHQYSPDLFIVQQVSNQAQLQQIADKMTAELAGNYRAEIIADASPAYQETGCAEKHYQTNGIIYREGRFRFNPATDRTKRWQAQHMTGSGCVNNGQSRTQAVAARLWDQWANKWVTVASVHWPTQQLNGPACAGSNEAEVRNELNDPLYDASLKIWGGDTNISDLTSTVKTAPFQSWYTSMNGDLGGSYYRDVIYDFCLKWHPGTSATAVQNRKQCLIDCHTVADNRRIDYLMASRQSANRPKIDFWAVIPAALANQSAERATGRPDDPLPYSDHLAVGGRINYAAG